ncbi:hypothetical protein I2W78_21255 [Streptomyces spinoverrucosus]|uniref:hypothetical protein n=1 Tax=Streptomyces spinoverrucosus TaxID=284043 RepID=UPI0018C3DB3F|nr:hypothetical protein [Streptomyces spinoverrucosus]MBG0854293.1 hypothetical protein [Streptomyces spinoverrucosus]
MAFYIVLLPLRLLTYRYIEAPSRTWAAALTPAGHERAALGRRQAQETSRWIEELLGPERLATLTRLLKELGDAGRDQQS